MLVIANTKLWDDGNSGATHLIWKSSLYQKWFPLMFLNVSSCRSRVDPFQCGRWSMEALVVSARRLNRLIGKPTPIRPYTSSQAQRLNQTHIQGRDGSTAPVTPPITCQTNLLYCKYFSQSCKSFIYPSPTRSTLFTKSSLSDGWLEMIDTFKCTTTTKMDLLFLYLSEL